MSINRHNYEEFFVLYTDNELSPGEQRMVEVFVQQHPDLKEELDTLLQYKLTPDTSVVFSGKEELMRQNGLPVITEGNYEEWLVLYSDNELNPAQRNLVEIFIAENPFARKDLELYKKAILQPENIEFPGKASLYRTEEKRRILPFNWRAAAALLLLALGLSAVLLFNKKQGLSKDDVVDNNPDQVTEPLKENLPVEYKENKNAIAVAPGEKNSPVVAPVTNMDKRSVNEPAVSNKNVKTNVADNRKTTPLVNLPENSPVQIKDKEVQSIADNNNNKPSNNLPQPLNNPNAIDNKTTDAFAKSNTPEENKNSTASGDENVTKDNASPSDYRPASMLEQPDGKKNKNRGIFRKIVRTFEKRTSIDPTDDNKLLVAGLSIKLK